MSAPRPSEADVETLQPYFDRVERGTIRDHTGLITAYYVPADDWRAIRSDLAARDAEHEREVANLLNNWRTHEERGNLQHARAEAAERALADLRAAVKALADRFENGGYGARFGWVIAADLRALLSRDDAAGAGGGA